MEKIILAGFTLNDWIKILLVIAGFLTLIIYWLQERKKINEAASLIILQIEELQGRIRELSTFIENGKINETSFYESLPLMDLSYWDKYKHYFVRKIDASSFTMLNLFYQYIAEIQEQQLLMKQLQKNTFFHTQNLIVNIETRLIFDSLNPTPQPTSQPQFVPQPMPLPTPQPTSQPQFVPQPMPLPTPQPMPQEFNLSQFIDKFIPQRENLRTIINQNIRLPYTPEQIRTSLEKIFLKYSMLEVTGNDGYRKLKKYSNRWF